MMRNSALIAATLVSALALSVTNEVRAEKRLPSKRGGLAGFPGTTQSAQFRSGAGGSTGANKLSPHFTPFHGGQLHVGHHGNHSKGAINHTNGVVLSHRLHHQKHDNHGQQLQGHHHHEHHKQHHHGPWSPSFHPTLRVGGYRAVIAPACVATPIVVPQFPVVAQQTTGVVVPRDDDTAVALPQVLVGGHVTLTGGGLGQQAGNIVVQIGEVSLPATVERWTPDTVVARLPHIGLAQPSQATLHVVKADGQIASSVAYLLIPPTQPLGERDS